jgi:hypothetical protein
VTREVCQALRRWSDSSSSSTQMTKCSRKQPVLSLPHSQGTTELMSEYLVRVDLLP